MLHKNKLVALLSFSILLFLLLSFSVTKFQTLSLDERIFAFVDNFPIFDGHVFQYITMIGSPNLLCLLAFFIGVPFLLFKRDVYSFLFMTLTPLFGSLLNRSLKHVYKRERPMIDELVDGTGYSFPSGHSTASMIFFGCLIYLIINSRWNLPAKWFSSIVLSLLILLIGLSRIYFHVHYPSDVLGGFAFGFSFLLFSIMLFGNRLKNN